MLNSIWRLFRFAMGVLLIGAAGLTAIVSTFYAIAMTVVWFNEGSYGLRHSPGWYNGWLVAVAAVLLTWAGVWLVRGTRPPGAPRPISFRLQSTRSGRQERWAYRISAVCWIGFAIGWVWKLAPGDTWSRPLRVVAVFAGGFLSLHIYVLAHEIGHLLAGWLLGFRLLGVRVGIGSRIARGRTRSGFRWEWCLWPFAGWAETVDQAPRPSGWRQFCIVAGGPLADVAFGTAILSMLHWSGSVNLLPDWLNQGEPVSILRVPLFVMLYMGFFGWVPRTPVIEGRQFYTDGWLLRRLPSIPAQDVAESVFVRTCNWMTELWKEGRREQARHELARAEIRFPDRTAALTLVEGEWHRQSNEPQAAAACLTRALTQIDLSPLNRSPHLWAEQAATLAATGNVEKARAVCAQVLSHTPDVTERVTLLDAFACLPILYPGTTALLADARDWCDEALRLAPDQITLLGTQAALILDAGPGREVEAMSMLQTLLKATNSNNDRGIGSFYLALAARRLGLEKEVEGYRQTALRFCTHAHLRHRLTAEIPVI